MLKCIDRLVRSAGVLFLAASLPALAEAQGSSTPSYDIVGYCEQVSQAVGGSYQIKNQCVKDEREALSAVQEMTGLDSRMVKYCADVGEAVGGSYQIYEQCLKDEREAKNAS